MTLKYANVHTHRFYTVPVRRDRTRRQTDTSGNMYPRFSQRTLKMFIYNSYLINQVYRDECIIIERPTALIETVEAQ